MEIVVAVLAFLGTTVGSIAGILTANKLVNYRLEQLEKKVSAHNDLVDRMYNVENRVGVLDEKVKVANHRIEDLESKKAR